MNKTTAPSRVAPLFIVATLMIVDNIFLALAWWSTAVLGLYGWMLFLGLPFIFGLVAAALSRRFGYKDLGPSFMFASLTLLMTAFGALLLGFEGAICIVMASPLILLLTLLGCWVGSATIPPEHLARVSAMLLFAAPLLMAFEAAVDLEPPLFAVRTAVEIDAPPEVVWRYVVSFSEIPEPEGWFFKTGLAYPLRARIEGSGVGAIRYCEFSTGPFVEPIEVWDEPRLLRFTVSENPPPMREWNPFHEVHPPHLDNFLVSRRGQFLLEPLPGGRTRLEGTTWYHHGLWPATYWRWWSDAIIHRIHERVLDHVRRVAERDA